MASLERTILSLLLNLLRRCPRFAMGALLGFVGFVARRAGRKEWRQFDRNVETILGLPAHSEFARQFKDQVIRHQAACAIETIQAIYDPQKLQVEGFDLLTQHVKRAEAEGKGHLILTAHLGSWELVAFYGALAASNPFRVLAKPARRPAMTEALDALRSRMGVKVLWTDRKTLLRDMLATLRGGGSVGFVMDQKPEGRAGPRVKFFDRETEFVAGPATMALKTGALPICLFCVREGPFRFRLITKVIEVSSDSTDASLTQEMATEIERVIRLYPEQWTWNYKRWRSADLETVRVPESTAQGKPAITT